MEWLDYSLLVKLVFGVPFLLACAGVVIAVFGKAAQRLPYQPDEERAFGRPHLPRWYSKIYVVQPPPRPKRGATGKHHENTDSKRAGRHGR